jgi:hypothetical protein
MRKYEMVVASETCQPVLPLVRIRRSGKCIAIARWCVVDAHARLRLPAKCTGGKINVRCDYIATKVYPSSFFVSHPAQVSNIPGTDHLGGNLPTYFCFMDSLYV